MGAFRGNPIVAQRKAGADMTVDTKTVAGRRALKFNSFDEIVADAEKLAGSPQTATLGNWPLDRLLIHLATAIHASIDGVKTKNAWVPQPLPASLKARALESGLPTGFQLPKDDEPLLYPQAKSPEEALGALCKAVERTKRESMTGAHPAFGPLTNEEWTQFHMRHAELHLSFAIPG